MDLVAGAMGNLAPMLLQLLQDEYKLHKGLRAQVKSLAQELETTHVALCKVAQVPPDQLDPQVRLWAREVREASYDMEDALDTFLVRVDGGGDQPANGDKAGKFERLREKMGKMFSISKFKARHEIADAIENIKKQVEEIAKRRDRYRIDDREAGTAATSIDPRLSTLHTKASELIGIDEPRDALIKMLSPGDDGPLDKEMKIVSVVGSGGLGKTTLAKAVFDKLAGEMNTCYKAFVPVGQNPDMKKILRDILRGLNKEYYTNKINYFMTLDESQLIEEIQEFLKEKRYFIVIDIPSWNTIKLALDNNNHGSKVIITTRCSNVAEQTRCSYRIQPLLPESSKILFYRRIFGSKDKCPEQFSELSEKFLKKCGGVPLAIITTSSLLANKLEDINEWQEVYDAIGSGHSSSHDMCNMRKILSLSYYHLPSHMKTCFLYLSTYPEDYEIMKDRLIWRWIAEGFIQPQQNSGGLFELGESYFNELINRSLVQPLGDMDSSDGIYGCRVHDMILDLICSLSREENFVTMLDDFEQKISSGCKLRRLSLRETTWPVMGLSQLRSITVFCPSLHSHSMPSLLCSDVLRVLDLKGCDLASNGSPKLSAGNLIHLRYLGLRGTFLRELPEEIEKLQFLQVLNVDIDHIGHKSLLPIFRLKRLMCLEGVMLRPSPGNQLRNLASLQVLDELCVNDKSAGAVEELGHLTQLRVLKIFITIRNMDQSLCDALINSLGNLRKLQSLDLVFFSGSRFLKWERWEPPRHLHKLQIRNDYSLLELPKWISPKSLPHVTFLSLSEVNLQPKDIQMLGTLPSLCELILAADERSLERPLQRFVVSADAFPRARRCVFHDIVIVPSMFPLGAMPSVESLSFSLRPGDFFSSGGFGFNDLALEHLPSLRQVDVKLGNGSKEEVTKVEEVLRHAAGVHPKHPSIYPSYSTGDERPWKIIMSRAARPT